MARILVVEDEEDVRTLSKSLLELLGHQVDDVASGERALIRMRRRHYDLVLTDVSLPGMDGWRVAQMVRRVSPGTRVGIVSGWVELLEGASLEERGVDFLLAKPFSLDEIEDILTPYK